MSVSRREFIVTASALVGAMPFRSALFAQAQISAAPSAATTKFETIRRNVGYFTGRGGTIGWLVNKDAALVVDSQYPETAKICLQGLQERSRRGIDVLFNTHHHADHTSGNGVFKPVVTRIIAHARVPELQKQAAAQSNAQEPPVLPTATFDKAWGEKAGNERVTAKHYGPAHTGGDAIIVFQNAHVVHMGDLLFREMHPVIDRPAGASIQNWLTSLETIAKEVPKDTIFIAGHAKAGVPVTAGKELLMAQRDYFDAVLTYVRTGLAHNQSRDEIAKLESLKGFESYQSAPPRLTLAFVLGVAYDELTAK